MNFIYALLDPSTKEVRYIGRTAISIERRFCEHLAPSQLQAGSYKNNWIRSLLSKDLKPEPIALAEFSKDFSDLEQAETDYINLYRALGARLTNQKFGSSGAHPGHIKSKDTKAEISARMMGQNNPMYGKKHSEETRRKISEKRKLHPGSLKGKKVRPEIIQKWIENHPRAKKVVDNHGTVYTSISAASRGTGIGRTKVLKMINTGEAFKGYVLQLRHLSSKELT